jgi:molybdopterin-guanine dinucleotide biosynthesis protein B
MFYKIPLLGICAYSGTGKTTLLTRLIPLLREQGLRVAVIKHAHHDFDIDHPGKDSFELRKADACQVVISSARRKVSITEIVDRPEPSLEELLEDIDLANIDLVLVEGFKHAPIPKIELHRVALRKPYLYPDDENVIALATDREIVPERPIPLLDISKPEQIARFILDLEVVRSRRTHRQDAEGEFSRVALSVVRS